MVRRNNNFRNSRSRRAFSSNRKNNRRNESKVYIDQNGYKRYSDSGKLVHRHVAEQMLGRKLKPQEVVHHKNRNKLDNSRSNLRVLPNQEAHEAVHRKSKRLSGKW